MVEANGAQVLPDISDTRQTVTSWAAYCCVSADQRSKHQVYRDLAARLIVEAVAA